MLETALIQIRDLGTNETLDVIEVEYSFEHENVPEDDPTFWYRQYRVIVMIQATVIQWCINNDVDLDSVGWSFHD